MNTEIYRHDILQLLIDTQGLHSYLEVGVADGACFKNIHIEQKEWVDPYPTVPDEFKDYGHVLESDEFFREKAAGRKWDLIFIDGLHTFGQCTRDLENAHKHLNPNGYVVLHDMLPPMPQFEDPTLCGTCWKAVADRRSWDKHFHYVTVETDYGVGVGHWSENEAELWPDRQNPWTLAYQMDHRRDLMNTVTFDYLKAVLTGEL